MKKRWILRGVRFAAIVAAFIAGFSLAVMLLWNWLTPALFGWHRIGFWQALGILILSRILLGGFRGRPDSRWYWRQRMMERWERMTPEERDKFRQGIRTRCGVYGPPISEAKPGAETNR